MPSSAFMPFQAIQILPLKTASDGPQLVATPLTDCCGAQAAPLKFENQMRWSCSMPFHAMTMRLSNTARPGGWPTPRSMLSIFAPSMLPQPVQASQPAADG
jgi:hypothetical protein